MLKRRLTIIIFLLSLSVSQYWIFRVNDPSAGSPTETLLRLLLPLSDKVYKTSHGISRTTNTAVQIIHRITQSVGATGGVYKGQGRIQRELMTHAYKAFLVQDARLQSSIPSTMQFSRFPKPFGQGAALVACIIVARVRPKTSKGITDLLLPYSSIC